MDTLLTTISVLITLQDTQCLFDTAGYNSSSCCSGSFTGKSLDSSSNTLSLGVVPHHSTAYMYTGHHNQPLQCTRWMEVTTLLGQLMSISSIKERSVVALHTTLHQCDPTLGTKVCHQYFLIPISFTRCTPVSNWSNRPLLSGGDSSCSWVFFSCTGPQFG